jgi:hypothetical protein
LANTSFCRVVVKCRLQLNNKPVAAHAAEGLHSCSQQVTKACAVAARAQLSTLFSAFEAGGDALFWPATGITQRNRDPDLQGREVAAPASEAQLATFSRAYTAGVRSMASAGLASLSTGLPLWKLGSAVFLPRELKGTVNKESLGSVIQVRSQFSCTCVRSSLLGSLLLVNSL